MTIEIWTTFVAVVLIFAIIPGPTVILVVGQAISYGKQSVLPLVIGVLLGDFVAMSLSLLGLGAVLATSATAFMILKWLGVFYLVYLGIKAFREEPSKTHINFDGKNISKLNMFKSSFLVTALNPKDIVFFVAFLPQFVNPLEQSLPQLLILMFTFLVIVASTISAFALFAGNLRTKIQNYHTRKRLNKLGGLSLITAGLITASMQKN